MYVVLHIRIYLHIPGLFSSNYCPPSQARNSPLRMEVAGLSETSVHIYQATRRHTSHDSLPSPQAYPLVSCIAAFFLSYFWHELCHLIVRIIAKVSYILHNNITVSVFLIFWSYSKLLANINGNMHKDGRLLYTDLRIMLIDWLIDWVFHDEAELTNEMCWVPTDGSRKIVERNACWREDLNCLVDRSVRNVYKL